MCAETERERGDVAECAAHSAQQTLAELEAAHAQQAQQLGSLNDQVSTNLSFCWSHLRWDGNTPLCLLEPADSKIPHAKWIL